MKYYIGIWVLIGVVVYSCHTLHKAASNNLNRIATNKTDGQGRKQGLWEFRVEHNMHYGDYYCLDTTHAPELKKNDLILAKGYYLNNEPVGLWIKYMPQLDSSYTEYFYYKNGDCYKHTYFNHRAPTTYSIMRLNTAGDTAISTNSVDTAFNLKKGCTWYTSNGRKQKFEIETMTTLYPNFFSDIYYSICEFDDMKDIYFQKYDTTNYTIRSAYSEKIYKDSTVKQLYDHDLPYYYRIIENRLSHTTDTILFNRNEKGLWEQEAK